jgi:hypothetical protein
MFLTPHRRAAGKKLLLGTSAFVLAMAVVFSRAESWRGSDTKSVFFKIFAISFYAMLIAALRPFFEGLIGFIFGVPFREFEPMLNTKPWWYVLGVIVLLVAITIAIFLYGLGYTLIWVFHVLDA